MLAKFKYTNNVCFIISTKQRSLEVFLNKRSYNKGYFLHNCTRNKEGYEDNDIYFLLFFQYKTKTQLILECDIGRKNSEKLSNMFVNKYTILSDSLRA
jgi:hypothetical protein